MDGCHESVMCVPMRMLEKRVFYNIREQVEVKEPKLED